MVYLTGDTHGKIDLFKLSSKNFRDQKHLTKNDYVIILGDTAIVWDGSSYDLELQKWLNDKPFTTLFLDGNHDCHPLIDQYETVHKFGGEVHHISKSIYHLKRGEIYNIDGISMLIMGGADSSDAAWRIEGLDWWRTETISSGDLDVAFENLLQRTQHNTVDIVLSHCAPRFVEKQIGSYISNTPSAQALECLMENINFKAWFCGHYHLDQQFQALRGQPVSVLYNRIIPLFK